MQVQNLFYINQITDKPNKTISMDMNSRHKMNSNMGNARQMIKARQGNT